MNQQLNQTASGTLTGTAMVLLMQVTNDEFLKTISMAALGAAVSFIVSFSIKALRKWLRKLS